MDNFKLDTRTIVIGAIILIGAIFFLPRLLNPDTPATNDDVVLDENEPAGQSASPVRLGQPVVSPAVDRDGCPVDTTDFLSVSDDVYIVAPNSDVPAGTSVFVRLYHEDTPIEDAPEIQADTDYTNTCINFVFEPIDGNFDPGDYEAEFFINGNPAESVNFALGN